MASRSGRAVQRYLRYEGNATGSPNGSRLLTKNVPLSENDARVLEILQQQGRRSYADLGSDLGMAAPSVHERVKKLEARGVIRGYAADVDPAAVGLSVRAFTWVRQAPGTVQVDLTPSFAVIPEI